jgi:undecaprenyl-diphosphatase
METVSVLILGIIQGLTEFLPISSSAHLIIVPNILNWQPVTDKLIFDVSLHIGSLFAVIFYFRKDWDLMLNSAIAKIKTPKISTNNTYNLNLLIKILISTLPVVVIGFLFKDFIDTSLRNTQIIAINLIIFGIVFYISDLIGKKNKQVKDLGINLIVMIGMFQVLALMPGVSRSAITITAALLVGLNRTEAARFSYLLAAANR